MFDMPPETLLTMFAHGMLSIQDDPQLVAVMRLYMSEAARTPEVADAIGGFQLNVLGFLVRYLEHQIAIGRLRPHDVQAIARMWMGAVMINLLGHQIFPVAGEGFPPRDAYVQSIVSVMLDGLRADP
ncbi:MAG: TetR/AcrR family transcriptional regulator C-terminal domain-containing protein [Chloroflexota bacterium]